MFIYSHCWLEDRQDVAVVETIEALCIIRGKTMTYMFKVITTYLFFK